jgi:thiol-disulfide isomerase/thioredoxin
MKKFLVTFIGLILIYLNAQGQTINGTLTKHIGQEITLIGFDYYETKELSKTIVDSIGRFSVTFPESYNGLGLLQTQDQSSIVVLLTGKNIKLKGTHLKEADHLHFEESIQNTALVNFAKNNTLRQKAYKAWRYLLPLYEKQNKHHKVLETIKQETARIAVADSIEINQLPNEYDYLKWFLTQRTLINDMPGTVYNYRERIQKNIQQFRNIDFSNPYFKTSGLFKELIEGHYMLLENMGKPIDGMYAEMNISTNYLLKGLKTNKHLANKVAAHLFAYFEKRSAFSSAEYLSKTMLNNYQNLLTDGLANTMQKYNILKRGNIAPDIQLTATKRLSHYQQPVLLVFGVSTCQHCKDEASELTNYYSKWKEKVNLEVVYISLDTDKDAYNAVYKNTPWKTFCDFKGWETQAAKDYFVNATPTYLLLDKDLKIVVHPRSLKQVNAWVNVKSK